MFKNRLRITGCVIALSLFAQNIAFAASETIVTDNDVEWQLQWNWERYQEGFEYLSSEIELENGLKITVDNDKYNDFVTYRYASNDSGATKCAESGEYKYYMRFDSEGNPVAYNSSDTTSTRVPIYHQGRDNYNVKLNVGESENTGEPIVLSYDYKITTPHTSWWNSPYMDVMGFTVRYDVGGKVQLVHNGGELAYEKDTKLDTHNIAMIISPDVTNGRYEMMAFMLDGNLVPLSGIYSKTTGKTTADCVLKELLFSIRVGLNVSAQITNLKVARGLDDVVLTSDFSNGSEITDSGIMVYSSSKMAENALNGNVSVYDCDFDDELIAEPGTVVTYSSDMMSASVKFTMLEAGGNYRMEITGVEDIFGSTYNDVLKVNFSTPASEDDNEGDGGIDDTPDSEADSSNLAVGDIAIGSSNTLYHGHNFYQASKTDGTYEILIDKAGWFNAEQNKYSKNGYYYFTDADGNEKQLGYGNDNWNKLDMVIGVTDSVDTTKPIVVSYEWYSENFGAVSEWGSNYMTVMGFQAFLSDNDQTKGMLKYYEDGNSKAETITLSESADGWHSMTLVISPQLSEGRCKLVSTVIDGVVKFYDKAYSVLKSDYTADTFVINDITAQIAAPKAADPAEGRLKLRNVEIKRLDGLKAEVFMPLGLQNPNEPIKLNFNYALEDEVTADDFSIYEISEGADGSLKETKISNRVEVSDAYDGKQLNVTVLDGGLYYDRSYKLVIDKNIVVENYITLSQTEYEFSTYKYPDDITAELTRAGDVVSYNISGGGDSFLIMVSTYDSRGALVGMNTVTAQKQGSGNREKARGTINISNADKGEKVLVYIFTADGDMKLYRLPTEL